MSPLKDALPKLRHSSLLHRAQIGFGIETKSSAQSQLQLQQPISKSSFSIFLSQLVKYLCKLDI